MYSLLVHLSSFSLSSPALLPAMRPALPLQRAPFPPCGPRTPICSNLRQDREQHRPFQHRNSNRLATRSGPPSSSFTVDLKVRDSELDQFLVVNNANYSVYLQHARHEFLEKIGLPVAAATEEGGALALSRLVFELQGAAAFGRHGEGRREGHVRKGGTGGDGAVD